VIDELKKSGKLEDFKNYQKAKGDTRPAPL
jgi:hypothetical protein